MAHGEHKAGDKFHGWWMHGQLWTDAQARAKREGRPLSAVLTMLLRGWVDGKITTPPEPAQPQ